MINPTSRGEEFIDRCCEIALEALAEIQRSIAEGDTARDNEPR